jgi:S1-C subfamily serine protease
MPYITVNPNTKEIMVLPQIELPAFYAALGLKGGDTILEVNKTAYNLDNIYDMIMGSQSWKEDDAITVKIKRDGKEMTLDGKVKLPYEDAKTYEATDKGKEKLKLAWLKG